MQVGFLTQLRRRTYFHNSRHVIGRKRQVLDELDAKQSKWRQMNVWKAFKMFGIWMEKYENQYDTSIVVIIEP